MRIRDRVRELRRVRARDLLPNPKNWRTHPKAQREALQGILSSIGYADALLARETPDGLQLVDGHLRAETTPEHEVPVLVLDLNEEEADTLLATLDPLAAMAGKDEDVLNQLLEGLDTENEALEALWAGLAPQSTPRKGARKPDEVPAPPAVPATRAGDLWTLGDHRLLCGDSTDAACVRRVMDGRRAALFQTDPPYLVDYTGERPNDSGKDWSGVYHEVEVKDAGAFFRAVFTHALTVVAPHAAVYCWHAHKRAALIDAVWGELGLLNHQQIVWVKPTAVFGRVFWHFRHEPCMMGWVKGSKPPHDGVHEYDSVWQVDWEGKARIVGNQHPTQKPVALFERPMRKHTREGDICFEPFSGSGSQLIAAERLGRRCYAIELEPHFVDVAVRRWQDFTGQTAVHAETGAPFPAPAAAAVDGAEEAGA